MDLERLVGAGLDTRGLSEEGRGQSAEEPGPANKSSLRTCLASLEMFTVSRCHSPFLRPGHWPGLPGLHCTGNSSSVSPATLGGRYCDRPHFADEEVRLEKVFYALPRGRNPYVVGLGFDPLKSNPIRSLLLAPCLPHCCGDAWPCRAPFLSLISFGICTPKGPQSQEIPEIMGSLGHRGPHASMHGCHGDVCSFRGPPHHLPVSSPGAPDFLSWAGQAG